VREIRAETPVWDFANEEGIVVRNRLFLCVILCIVGVVMASTTGCWALSAEKQPLLHFTFDEGAGDVLTDATGSGKIALLEGGVEWSTEGVSGGALVFKGVDGFVRLPDNVAKDLDAMTIALWVKLNSNPLWARVFDFAGSKGFMYLTLNAGAPADNTRFSIYAGDPDKEPILSIPVDNFALDTWYHIAVTAGSGEGAEYCFYVDGELKATLPVTHASKDIGSDVLMSNYLGKSQFPDPYFDGMMDEFYLFTEALSADEIAALSKR